MRVFATNWFEPMGVRRTPTAVQVPEPAGGHATPRRTLVTDELESALGTTDQVVPSKVSTSVWSTDPLLKAPTAVHELIETHATLESRSAPEPGFGLGTTDQVVPSQASINVSCGLVLVA
jgi:hypothetical protein